MRRWVPLTLALLLAVASVPSSASADHLPRELRFLHRLVRVSTDNLCIDPETLAPAICHIYRDPASADRYRLIYRGLTLVSVWRMERDKWRPVWALQIDCSVEPCA